MQKRTKIIATISDINCDVPLITDLYQNGMNVARFNTAHQNPEDTLRPLNIIREVSKKIAIMVDTKGPEVRTNEFAEGLKLVKVKTGDTIFFDGDSKALSTEDVIYVNYNYFVEEVPVGQQILIDDGSIGFTVLEKKEGKLFCRADNPGKIEGRKSVNTPSLSLNIPSLSKKDIDYIGFIAEHNIDFIAHSFVRTKEDVIAIQKLLDEKGSNAKIIAKIENLEGVENLDEIIEHSYGIMVARGDLGVEIPTQKIPVIQKHMVETCIKARKPVIVATQMLESMTDSPRPTRAEVSDVANAIFDGTDAIMLSGETAKGKYPRESVKMMNDIAIEVEQEIDARFDIEAKNLNTEVSGYICKSAVMAASNLNTKGIVADTLTGSTIRNMAGFRGKQPIYALCYKEEVIRSLALSYGVYPSYINKDNKTPDQLIQTVSDKFVKTHNFDKNDLLVITSSGRGVQRGSSFMEISTVENLVNSHIVEVEINDL